MPILMSQVIEEEEEKSLLRESKPMELLEKRESKH